MKCLIFERLPKKKKEKKRHSSNTSKKKEPDVLNWNTRTALASEYFLFTDNKIIKSIFFFWKNNNKKTTQEEQTKKAASLSEQDNVTNSFGSTFWVF